MGNKALELLNQQEALGARGEQAFAELQQTQDKIMSSGDTAEFDWPDALKTGVAAGWILGPAGGLAIGLAQGFLNKQARQSLLDEQANYNATIDQLEGVYGEQFAQARGLADNDQDKALLDAMERKNAAGFAMMQSPDPRIQEMGRKQFEEAQQEYNDWMTTNEAQAIDERRYMDEQTYSRHRSLYGDFRNESASFEGQIATANNAIEALNRGDGAAVTAALASMPLLVNPQAGATTDTEVAIWGNVTGMVEGLLGSIQKELGGGGLTDTTRQQIIETAEQYRRNAIQVQQWRESEYGKALVAEGINERYWGMYNKTGSIPGVGGQGFVPGEQNREESGGLVNDAKQTLGLFSDQNLANNISYALGLHDYEPQSLEEMAENNPRAAKALSFQRGGR